jgi:hypothetical protein
MLPGAIALASWWMTLEDASWLLDTAPERAQCNSMFLSQPAAEALWPQDRMTNTPWIQPRSKPLAAVVLAMTGNIMVLSPTPTLDVEPVMSKEILTDSLIVNLRAQPFILVMDRPALLEFCTW